MLGGVLDQRTDRVMQRRRAPQLVHALVERGHRMDVDGVDGHLEGCVRVELHGREPERTLAVAVGIDELVVAADEVRGEGGWDTRLAAPVTATRVCALSDPRPPPRSARRCAAPRPA